VAIMNWGRRERVCRGLFYEAMDKSRHDYYKTVWKELEYLDLREKVAGDSRKLQNEEFHITRHQLKDEMGGTCSTHER
jgi:hypothetical protein